MICSILSAMFFYRPELIGKITPDSMKDAVLGENYANKGTDAAWFVNYVSQHGLKLYSVTGNPVELAHQLIQKGQAAIFTEVDPYVNTSLPQYAGWTHVGSFFKEVAGGLDAMDPFGGKLVSKSDSDWSKVLVGNEIWTVERTGTMGVPANWHDDGATLTASNGVKIVHGFRDYVLAHNWDENNVPLGVEYATAQLEDSNTSLGNGTQQLFRLSMLGWTASRGVFEEWVGQELSYARSQVAKYYALIQQLQQQVTTLQAQAPANPDALAAIKQVQVISAPFK